MTVVSSAGPPITLAKRGRLDLLRQTLSAVRIPQAVFDEICVRGVGRAGDREVRQASGLWLTVCRVQDVMVVRSLLTKLAEGKRKP